MAGRNTFMQDGKIGPARAGAIVGDHGAYPSALTSIDAVLGRSLTDAERADIANALAMWSAVFRERREEPSRQDVKRTLRALTHVPDDDADAALAAADAITEALVHGEQAANPALRVQHAAQQALDRLNASEGGRRSDEDALVQFAQVCQHLWDRVSGSASPRDELRDGMSPIVAFAHALFSVVYPLSPSRVRHLLVARFRP